MKQVLRIAQIAALSAERRGQHAKVGRNAQARWTFHKFQL